MASTSGDQSERNQDPPDGDTEAGGSTTAARLEAIAARIDLRVREVLARYVNIDGWTDEGEQHTAGSFALRRDTVGSGHLVAIQWGYRRREANYPSYPEVRLERHGEDNAILKLWAPSGNAHPSRLQLGNDLHAISGLPVEVYGDFMVSKDPERVEAWREYRRCDGRFPEV